MPWHGPRGALSINGGKVYDDAERKKPGRAAIQQTNLEAVAAAKLASGGDGSWHPDGIVQGSGAGVPLMVVEKERLAGGRVAVDGTAYVAPADGSEGPATAALYAALTPTCVLQHCGGSDCAITVSTTAPWGMVVPPGCIALDAVQRINLHVAHNTVYKFELLEDEMKVLVDIELEASLLPPNMRLTEQISELAHNPDAVAEAARCARLAQLGSPSEPEPEFEGAGVEAATLRRLFAKAFFQRCLSLNEKVVVAVGGLAVLLRVKSVNDKTAEEQAEMPVYHCFRGVVTAATEVYLLAELESDGHELRTVTPLRVFGAAARDPGVNRAEIKVETDDEEWFPVKRSLLQPCIGLTAVLRDRDVPTVQVPMDCLIFDKVLLFLEAEALDRAFDFDINQVEDMAKAARALGCQTLLDRCNEKVPFNTHSAPSILAFHPWDTVAFQG